jgi:para-aminobenzoate synthetase
MSWSLAIRNLDFAVDARSAFAELFAERDHAFWLDSSLVEPGLSRFSFLGDAAGPHGEVLSYRAGSGVVEARSGSRHRTLVAGSIFEVLEARLAERAIEPCPELPFDFTCGYVGYLGYELKGDCGSSNRHDSPLPDAVLIGATRFMAIDHLKRQTWLLALCSEDRESARAAQAWLDDVGARLSALPETPTGPDAQPTASTSVDSMTARAIPCRGSDEEHATAFDPEPWLLRSRSGYMADIEYCQTRLRAGESYQICLTNTVELPFSGDPFALYLSLRSSNPATHAAYLRFDGTRVLCSSPERFLKVGADRTIESRPIKGTAPRRLDRCADATLREALAADAKNRAENITIVDLVRNDLGRVCEPGTISVPSLTAIESYATVHQLVSTVRGRLHPGLSAVDAVRACFPGGSMTGAPKLRTMEIIDALETRARGVYSGAIGYFGLDGGADLNIVIRTMVVDRGRLTVGAGGAITVDSDPYEEYEEMLLKARAPLRALEPHTREALLSPDRR